ncbi:MAG: AAA family ATPase [Eggerthellaceae bacterium]
MSKKDTAKSKQLALRKRPTQKQPFFLEHVKITSFGRFANTIVGPFIQGMNVVYGPNEAGKTTLNELVKGVLFGWPAARGEANSYRPENAERSGSLFFKNTTTHDVVELKRIKNSDDVSLPNTLMTDIDKETYETMFSLTSDELMRLDRHSDITARLLTAGSGTSSSPAHALEEINSRIKVLTSRSSHNPDSISNLKAEQTRLRGLIRTEREEADQLREQERILASLRPRSEMLQGTQERLNTEIEELGKAIAQIDSFDMRIAVLEGELDKVCEAEKQSGQQARPYLDDDIAPLVDLTQSEEYLLYDALDDFDQKKIKLDHAIDNARAVANASQVEYELHSEDGQKQQQYERARIQRRLRIGMAVVIPLVMVAIGAAIIGSALQGSGSSYLIAGVSVVVFALVMAVAGIAMALRPTRTEEEWADERNKKEWVMQQDRKNLEMCERDARVHTEQVEAFLADQGLGAALGSTKRARRILDRLREYRAACELTDQTHRAQAAHRSSLVTELDQIRSEYRALCARAQVSDETPLDDLRTILDRKTIERSKTVELAHETQRQIGEITERLANASRGMSFDELKFKNETIETRLHEQYRELAMLLLAQRSLEQAIADWERKSQPEVYKCASRLFAQMTDGAWRVVRMNARGDIEVVDAVKTARSPHLLSLGTRQQLYLSLRIALLLTADNVGRGLPIMCDDILVNFDNERRVQAVRALVELAKKRQVILFTCHPDVASLVCNTDPQCNMIEL